MKDIIVIIGGGIAGMEAAKQLLRLGYAPILVERTAQLGGHVAQWHKLFPDMATANDLISRLAVETNGIRLFLETQVKEIQPLTNRYNVILDNGVQVVAKSILVATGFQLFDAAKKEEYGYGIYERVITNADLEAWFNGNSEARVPKTVNAVGFVHCVGSRDLKAGNSQCSKVCCMTAIKQAIEFKERHPAAEIYCFYMDLRLFGKKYEDFYIQAQRDYGIHFIRGRVSEVGEIIDGRVQVKAEDTLTGKPLKVALDLLVLMAGMVRKNQISNDLASKLRLPIDDDGFLKSRDNIYGIVETASPGIFYAGACTGAKTIPETVAEARAAALCIHHYNRETK